MRAIRFMPLWHLIFVCGCDYENEMSFITHYPNRAFYDLLSDEEEISVKISGHLSCPSQNRSPDQSEKLISKDASRKCQEEGASLDIFELIDFQFFYV